MCCLAKLKSNKANSLNVYPPHILYYKIKGPWREKSCLQGFANNTGEDQTANPRRLISAFDIQLLESTIRRLATGDISII